jgi:hypothetical protein
MADLKDEEIKEKKFIFNTYRKDQSISSEVLQI